MLGILEMTIKPLNLIHLNISQTSILEIKMRPLDYLSKFKYLNFNRASTLAGKLEKLEKLEKGPFMKSRLEKLEKGAFSKTGGWKGWKIEIAWILKVCFVV